MTWFLQEERNIFFALKIAIELTKAVPWVYDIFYNVLNPKSKRMKLWDAHDAAPQNKDPDQDASWLKPTSRLPRHKFILLINDELPLETATAAAAIV